MSRKVIGKVKVKGFLVAQSPISVGGAGTGEHVDLELAEDGTGQCYIPGTSLAGPMRAWIEKRWGKELANDIFGYINQKTDGGMASPLFISDGPIKSESIIENIGRERRHGISIQDATGTTREGFFYTRALLPRGTCLPLNMELDILEGESYPHGHPAGALARLLTALQNGEIRFGACKTRGMGTVALQELKVDYYDFAKPEALAQWLGEEPSSSRGLEALSGFSVPAPKETKTCAVTVKWTAKSPLMVKAGRDGVEADMLPLMSGVRRGLDTKKKVAPVIPGSSIKGVLRSQARKILNTLFDPDYDPKYDGEKQNEERWEILSSLFGSKEAAGHLSVSDVYYDANNPIPLGKWLDEDTDAMNTVTEKRQHVAIDRFTGGASDSALYSARPVKRDEENESGWEPIHLTLDESNALSEENVKKEQALIKLLLRDMKDGYITIGFGSRRGLGEIEVKEIDYGAGFPEDSELQSAWDDFVSSEGKDFDVDKEEDDDA